MEQQDISFRKLQDVPEALSLPHFDEEATLMSARPVVPLHEVRAVTRSKRRLIFALSIVAAILVGGFGGSLLLPPNDNATTNVTQDSSVTPSSPSPQESGGVAVNAAHSNVDQPVAPEASTSVRKEESDLHPTAVPSSKKSTLNKVQARPSDTARPTHVNSRTEPSSASQSEADELEIEERMLRREERREARRLRRERRNARERSGDDLMRIREIFEGTPRP